MGFFRDRVPVDTSGPDLRRRLLMACLLATLGIVPVAAQNVSKVGTTAGEFLQIGVGPRATAMGGAFVAAANDVSALYWNPAGIAAMDMSEAIISHSEWLGEVDFDYLGVALSFPGYGNFGVSVTMLSVPEMMVRTEDRQDGTGEMFDAADIAVGLTYARTITDRFSIGATAKYIQQRIWHSSATGLAVDIGTQFRTDFFGGLVIGASLYNFGTDMRMNGRDLRTFVDPDPRQEGNNPRIPANYEMDAWSLPLNFQIGASIRPMQSRMHSLLLSVDALHPGSNYESVNIGGEYGFMGRLFLRSGFQSLFLEDAEGGFTGGVAVHQPLPYRGGLAKLDYAYRAANRLGGAHTVGLSVTF